jgi:hypothetical protein
MFRRACLFSVYTDVRVNIRAMLRTEWPWTRMTGNYSARKPATFARHRKRPAMLGSSLGGRLGLLT